MAGTRKRANDLGAPPAGAGAHALVWKLDAPYEVRTAARAGRRLVGAG